MAEASQGLKSLEDFSVSDLEAVRILLRGDSVIDWHRLNFQNTDDVRAFLGSHEFNPDDPKDRARIDAIKDEAISYLRRHFEYPIPKPVENASFEELLLLAGSRGHRQTCACTIAKCMHIIHHLDGRELLFMLPLSDQEVFHLVEEKVYRIVGGMLAEHFPITEFVGGRKHKDSLYTKLLSKQETIASQVYDKLRFRIVTRDEKDIFPVLEYLTKKLFPFNYVIPGQSINGMFPFKQYCEKNPRLKPMLPEMQAGTDLDLTPSDNIFSAQNYRVVHFVVDMPVRLPARVIDKAPDAAIGLGPVIFVVCEFQVIDRATEAANELGEASHAKYKERQKKAVMRRLQLGMREVTSPPPRPESESNESADFVSGKAQTRGKTDKASVKKRPSIVPGPSRKK
jgi:uncharacterized protein (TIGR04552 family)